MKNGFTLVELSIVLVIIGLLVGGVLVGQSLIESAKINRFISDLKQYEVAVNQFKSKFKQYPGDSRFFTPAGNADGDLADGGLGCTGNYAAYEAYQIWGHLGQAGMIRPTYVAHSPIGCGTGTQYSYNDDSNAGIVWPYVEFDAEAAKFRGRSKDRISAAKYSTSNLFFDFYINAERALAIENKLGVQDNLGGNKIGLVNLLNSHNCYDEFVAVVLCSDSTAVIGYFAYYIQSL